MNAHPDCPVCEADDWELIGQRAYDRSSIQSQNQYVQKRMRVLFEIWHPGEEQVIHDSLLCRQCGFVIYSPRPSADDLDRKYRFLTSLEPDENESCISPERESGRAQRLWKTMRPYLHDPPGRVLDFGGGDGRLVVPFAQRGYDCFVLDYHPVAVDGVTQLGATLDEINETERFDIIVCSHVMEHVADPCSILTRLRGHLSESGIIYIEVPMEIWKRAPLHEEPVTHVNFFTVGALRTLIERAGFDPRRVRMEDYAHPLGHHAVVVSAIAENRNGAPRGIRLSGADETRRLLNPGWSDRIQRALLRPEHVPKAIWTNLTSRVRR